MSHDRINILLRKIQSILLEDHQINTLEKDLAKKYTVELYELIDDLKMVRGEDTGMQALPNNPFLSKAETRVPIHFEDETSREPKMENPEPNSQTHSPISSSRLEREAHHSEESDQFDIGKDHKASFILDEGAVADHPPSPMDKEPVAPRFLHDLQQVVTRRESTPPKFAALFQVNEQRELSDKLSRSPIADLRKVLSINDKLLVVNDLFRGEQESFQETIDILNAKYSFEEAKSYLSRYIIDKFEWLDEQKVDRARDFIKLVERRFLDS